MEESNDFKKAVGIALKLLSRSDKTILQIKQKLAEFDESTVNNVIEYLKKKRFADDERFAEQYYQSKKKKKWGGLKIRLSLKNLGILDEIIDFTMKDVDSYEKKAALELLKKRKKTDSRDKNIRFLLSRGFSYESIRSILKDDSGNIS
ncbi:MAG: regulatory protein RecX [Epsilonproteobacteria bacterium]|nr:regulatory protein RecX [Campylobacterota bacterium]